MAKGKRKLGELMEKLDLVVEVRDARAPFSTSSPMIAEFSKIRSVVTILSKKDLADPERSRVWKNEFVREKKDVWEFDLRKDKLESLRKALSRFSPPHRELRLAVVGIPNVGKSLFLNALMGKARAKVGGIPGITRDVSWYKCGGFLVVDSPGILDPHSERGAHRILSWLGCAPAEVLGGYEASALELIRFLRDRELWDVVEKTWGIAKPGESDDGAETLERVGRRLGCLIAGGTINRELAGRRLVDSFAAGKLGSVTLELPGDPLWGQRLWSQEQESELPENPS
jgi:ribosome biogenesis GTPase A